MIGIVVRADQQHPISGALSRDEVEHLQRRAVSPLQILEDDEQRALRGKAREKLREVPEQTRLELRWIAARRCGRAVVAVERWKQLHQLRRATARQQCEDRRFERAKYRKQ